ncbi:uncharacterized protein LOC111082867 [Drosophila obscura]|uniref:uncharacterized protein LOC111082867 n=1 Tax=Drosophila obscura TaxID=7282 RepID=UPI001BB23DAC|nr:uncharacterized protein LOC111082867 [Drosophila obscura]
MDFREINKLNWRLNLNNNNSLVEYSSAVNKYTTSDVPDEHPQLLRQIDCATGATTMGTKQKQAPTTPASVSASAISVNDEGGGVGGAVGTGTETGTGDCAAAATAAVASLETEGGGVVGDKIGGAAAAYCALDLDVTGYGMAAAAAALSPTDAAFGGGLSSSRTSMNNSTENLSYASDNFYGDDLILLDDDDVEAEEISLNSDDCVYAYRGDGADFDLSMDAAAMGRGGRHHLDFGLPVGMPDLLGADDETEFLEMDFEPDPSSELEFASGAQDLGALPQANLLLMQRDYSQMSGMGMVTPTQGRQLYSSPIDDFPQEDALQQQKQRLNKKFARISLNLDQIKDGTGSGVDMDLDELIGGTEEEGGPPHVGGQLADTALAQSLPSTLYTGSSFSRSTSVPSDHPEPKLTGAKPKRLSNSSSVMSKSSSSSKSRRSQPSASFDERCYSCTDFRATSASSCQQLPLQATDTVAPMLVAAAAVVAMAASSSSMAHFDLTSGNEENCLDCLEKEFLANTIGKALDMSTCPKCRRRVGSNRGSSLSLYTRAEQTRCRSGSPGYFDEAGGLFAGWHSGAAGAGPSLGPAYNQRFISCDNNFGGVQLLKQSFSTEPLVARLSTGQLCDEEHLVQALDKLHISYDKSLLHAYFAQLSKPAGSSGAGNLKQLLLQASKRQCNHRKLKKLIELATQQQLHVQFKRTNEGDTSKAAAAAAALVPVRVADILDAWARHRDLSVLRQLDARFHRANVLGKVGQIVRQAAAASFAAATAVASSTSNSATRRALTEFLMIPQYYDSGELTLTRKC